MTDDVSVGNHIKQLGILINGSISHEGEILSVSRETEGCYTNVSRALQNNLMKIYNARNQIYVEKFKLKLCTCAQSMA